MLDYLLNKTAVFYGPRRLGGIVKNRLMVRLGFVQLDILPDSCLKDNAPKIGADILKNLVRESRPTIEESSNDTSNCKMRMVEAPFDSIDRVHDLLYAFECEIGHGDRNIDLSSGKESIDCQES